MVSTDCFTDLAACNSYAILIHAAFVADEDFKMLWNYYPEVVTNALDAIIVVGNTDVPKQLKKRIKVYFGFEELCQDLKYILLSAYHSHKKTVNFSATLANAIVILSKIRCCPGKNNVERILSVTEKEKNRNHHQQASLGIYRGIACYYHFILLLLLGLLKLRIGNQRHQCKKYFPLHAVCGILPAESVVHQSSAEPST